MIASLQSAAVPGPLSLLCQLQLSAPFSCGQLRGALSCVELQLVPTQLYGGTQDGRLLLLDTRMLGAGGGTQVAVAEESRCHSMQMMQLLACRLMPWLGA